MRTTYKKAKRIINNLEDKNVGLITGGFDVIHFGHISLFEFASNNVDIVFVGLDQDKTIKGSKGNGRPLFTYEIRSKVIDAIKYVNYVFEVPVTYKLKDTDYDIYKKMIAGLGVDSLISCSAADKLFNGKKRLCKELGIKLLNDKRQKITSSSDIIDGI